MHRTASKQSNGNDQSEHPSGFRGSVGGVNFLRFLGVIVLLVLASSLYASFQTAVLGTVDKKDTIENQVILEKTAADIVKVNKEQSVVPRTKMDAIKKIESKTDAAKSLLQDNSNSTTSQAMSTKKEDTKAAKNGVMNQNDKASDKINRIKGETEKKTEPQDSSKTAHSSPMNIVFFYADDWTFRTLGIINKNVHTPNIDEMARCGMLFRHNCVTTSICWQSRATMITGQYVSVHQQVDVSSNAIFNQTVQWTDTLYPLLKKQGYHIGYIGKWHAPMPREFQKQAWDYHNLYYGRHWMERNGKRRHVTDLNGEDSLHYLRKVRPKDQHFAMTIAFFATHSWDGKKYPDQYMPQNRTEPLYRNATIPTPKTATEQHWKNLPFFFDERNEARYRWKLRYDTPEHFQVSMKRYYRMATEVDDVVGDVINELKEQGVYNNTLLIFTTDNGQFHGEHGLAGKWYPHEESVRVPLIIQDPRMPTNQMGTVNDEFTLNIDLAPTILSAAGSPVPPTMQGRDMAQLYLNPQATASTWRKGFFYEWNYGGNIQDARGHRFGHIPAVFALIRKNYKYFYWPRDDYEQIFHIEQDPFEENDIFNSTTKSNIDMYKELKARYAFLKNMSQSGRQV